MARINEVDLASTIADSVNSMGFDFNAFNKAMNNEHRTLQQSFTRLVSAWLTYVASDAYQTDLRNEDTKRLGQAFVANCGDIGLRRV